MAEWLTFTPRLHLATVQLRDKIWEWPSYELCTAMMSSQIASFQTKYAPLAADNVINTYNCRLAPVS